MRVYLRFGRDLKQLKQVVPEKHDENSAGEGEQRCSDRRLRKAVPLRLRSATVSLVSLVVDRQTASPFISALNGQRLMARRRNNLGDPSVGKRMT
jgi:hypothetical protein